MRRATLLVSLVLVSATAHAEGPGIRLGETVVLHLGLAAGASYDTNPFYRRTNEAWAVGVDIRPSIDLATRPPQRGGDTPHTMDFRLHLGAPMRLRVATKDGFNKLNSFDTEASLFLGLFPQGNYAFDLQLNFNRLMLTPYLDLVSSGNEGTINTDLGQAVLKLRLRPGGQRLEISIQYAPGFQIFETAPYTDRNNLSNDFQLRLAWKFFPKTAIYINAQETIYTPLGTSSATNAVPPAAYPLRAVFGLIGLITPTLTVNVNAGYGNSLTQTNAAFPSTKSYNMLVALVELTWKPLLTTSLTLGYKHDFAQALVGTYYSLDTPYLAFAMQFIQRITAQIRFGYQYRAYAGPLGASGFSNGIGAVAERRDHLIEVAPQIDIAIRDWMYVSVGDTIQYNSSNCRLAGGMTGAALDPCSYFRNDVWLRLGVAY
jgi:hypothetical protein